MDKRLRIVQVMATTGGVMGGLEKHTFELCAALAEKHEVHLLADKPYGITCPKNVVFHALDFNKSRLNPFLYWQIAQTINHIQPQIVHAQAGKAASLIRAMKWIFQQIVFVATVHCIKKNINSYAAMDGVITVSSQLATSFASEKVRVIYSGSKIPPALQAHEKKAIRLALLDGQEKPLVIAVGRLVPAKAFDILLRAFVGVDARLVIVGDGVERQNLERLSNELGLQDNVMFLGQRSDVAQLLQAADLCVVASRQEGFSRAMVEALLVGCPVISTHVGGAKEWLAEALLCEANNVESLQTLLCDTLRRLPLLRTNYLPMFLRAQQELTVEGMTQHTQEFYQALLEQHR